MRSLALRTEIRNVMGRIPLVKLTVVGAWLLTAACGGGSAPAPAGESAAPAAASKSTASGGGTTTAGASASKVNMDEIFPAGAGRDLVLNNCQNCHTFVPIVILQMDEDAWTRSSLDHRSR